LFCLVKGLFDLFNSRNLGSVLGVKVRNGGVIIDFVNSTSYVLGLYIPSRLKLMIVKVFIIHSGTHHLNMDIASIVNMEAISDTGLLPPTYSFIRTLVCTICG
jgi:hypothetical protein